MAIPPVREGERVEMYRRYSPVMPHCKPCRTGVDSGRVRNCAERFVQQPYVDDPRGVPPEDVVLAIPVEVAQAHNLPVSADPAVDEALGEDTGPVQLPLIDGPRGVPPQDVGL